MPHFTLPRAAARLVLAAACTAAALASCASPSGHDGLILSPRHVPRPKSDYETAFEGRAAFYMDQIAAEGPDKSAAWAKSIKDLGDPHKYVMPVILAALSKNPKDPVALDAYRYLMTVDVSKGQIDPNTGATRGDRGLYHFAIYPRTRMFFQFKDQLPDDVKNAMLYDVRHWFQQLRAGGTENHHWMHRASGYLWAEYLPDVGGQKVPAKDGGKTNLEWERDWLRAEVKKLYTAGQGEYDSSTYVAFSMASTANVFDFAQDQKMRDLARAHLEWCAAAQGLKYFHGVNAGPEARGFAKAASDPAITDTANWLYFGDNPTQDAEYKSAPIKFPKHASTVLALSKYRPHPVIRNIATKNVQLPFESRNSKPDYYGPKGNKDQEYLYADREFAMTTLYSPEDGVATKGTILPQTTMFKLTVRGKGDTVTFGMANGYHGHFPLEGRGPFDQYHQKGAAALLISNVDRELITQWNQRNGPKPDSKFADPVRQISPEELARVKERSLFGVPAYAGKGEARDGWFFFQVNNAYVAARPLTEGANWDDSPNEKEKEPSHHFLSASGKTTGWAVQAGQAPEYPTLAAFEDAVVAKCKLDTSKLAAERTATLTTLAGDTITLRHTGGPGGRPDAWTNGQKLSYDNWPVYDNPYMKEPAGSGVLTLTDGRQTLTIDFSGDWPVFKEK